MKGMFLGFVFLILACFGIVAQERVLEKPQVLINLAQRDEESGKIEIIQSAQIENMLQMQIANNRQQDGIPGYRIRIASQRDRQNADQTRRDFMRRFPEINAYQQWNAPVFHVFVGDFRTKNEALRELKRIERFFQGAFIVSQTIQISN